MKQSIFSFRSKRTIYWGTTILVALIFFITGIANLIPLPHIAQEMLTLGYPRYFMVILGVWKVLGAVVVVVPGTRLLKEWAYAGLMFDVTGAAASRLVSGSEMLMVGIPVLIGCLVVVSWASRPPEKSLL